MHLKTCHKDCQPWPKKQQTQFEIAGVSWDMTRMYLFFHASGLNIIIKQTPKNKARETA